MTIRVLSYRDKTPENTLIIDTTTRSKTWSRNLSPMIAGPVVANGIECRNVENAWQYSKVYPEHINKQGNPKPQYFLWRNKGYRKNWAERYPMGKKAKPLYTWWDDKKFNYIDAKKMIYIPLYVNAIRHTKAYEKLKDLHNTNRDLVLLDFDAYDHINLNMTWEDVINNPNKKFGHAFVLAMMLEGVLC